MNPAPRRPPVLPPRGSLAARFRTEIEAAESAGTAREAMTLRLTLRDASNIRRDNDIAVEDISFTGGEMRLLKVKVVAGGVDVSKLDLGEAKA
jgi:hypothetical protein